MHIHYHEEKCYEDEIFFYHLGCHQWVSSHELVPPITHGKGIEHSLGSAIIGGRILWEACRCSPSFLTATLRGRLG